MHIWTMLLQKILQNHLLCAFVANLKICAIFFCDKNIAIRKVFAFCDSAQAIAQALATYKNLSYSLSFGPRARIEI